MMIMNRIHDRLYEDVSLYPRSDRDVGSAQELYDLFECISKYPNGHVELVAVGYNLFAYVTPVSRAKASMTSTISPWSTQSLYWSNLSQFNKAGKVW